MQHEVRGLRDAIQREKGHRSKGARAAGWTASALLSAGLLAGCGTSPPDNISLPADGSAASTASSASQAASTPGTASAAAPVPSRDVRTEPVRWEQTKPGCQGRHCPAITLDSLGFPGLPKLTVAIDQMLSSMTGVDENLSGVYGNVPGYAAYFWRTAQDGDHTWLRARLRGVVGDAISVELDTTQQIVGAAHPIPATHFLLWNRKADKQIHLDDVLAGGRHAQYLEALRAAYGLWLKANPGYQRDPAGYARLWPFLESDNVALTEQGLVVKYDAYTIAPYSYGQPEIVLPWATARTFVRPEFLPD